MRWFKHFSDALDDIFVQELILKFGGNGYMAYFGLIEIIAKENGKNLTGKLEISPAILKQKFHISRGKLEEIFRFCDGKGKVLFENNLENWKLEIPNMLKFKDEYTRKSGHTPDNVPSHIRVKNTEVEEEVDIEKKTLLRNVKEKVLAVDKKLVYGEFKNVKLLDVEIEKLNTKFGVEKTSSMIESLSQYLAKTGKEYKLHYAALLTWDRMTPKGDQAQTQKQKDLMDKYAHITGEI